MNNEEKILEILTKMQAQLGQVQAQLGQVQAQQEQMQTQQEQMQTQMGRMQTQMDQMNVRLDQTQDDVQQIKLYLELDVEKRFAAINEGIDVIQETLQEKLIPMERMDKAEDDIVVLKTVVKTLARDVAELKKAE